MIGTLFKLEGTVEQPCFNIFAGDFRFFTCERVSSVFYGILVKSRTDWNKVQVFTGPIVSPTVDVRHFAFMNIAN